MGWIHAGTGGKGRDLLQEKIARAEEARWEQYRRDLDELTAASAVLEATEEAAAAAHKAELLALWGPAEEDIEPVGVLRMARGAKALLTDEEREAIAAAKAIINEIESRSRAAYDKVMAEMH